MKYKDVENELIKRTKEVYLKGLLDGKNIFAGSIIDAINKRGDINTVDDFNSLIAEIKRLCNIIENATEIHIDKATGGTKYEE